MTPMPAAEPVDAAARRAVRPVVVYPNGTLEMPDLARLEEAKRSMKKSMRSSCRRVTAAAFMCQRGISFAS